MIEATFTVQGLAELEKKLRRVRTDIREKVTKKALRAGGKVFQSAAMSNAPVSIDTRDVPRERKRTHLRENIKMSVRRHRSDPDSVSAIVGPDPEHFYGRFLEYGTRFIPPRAWLTRSFDGAKSMARAAVAGTYARYFARGHI